MTGSGLRTYARNHYFYGKLMTVRDFLAEQEYHRDKQRFHNRFLHDYGIVAGLKVQGDAGGSPCRLVLAPGFAVDACGREIIVPQAVDLDLTALLAEARIPQSATEVYVRLAYAECETESVPVYARQCSTDDECAANRMSEGFRVRLTTDKPAETGGGVSDICGLVQQAVGPFVATPGDGEVADAPPPDLYKLLCARSLDAQPWAGQVCGPQQQADLHLATVPMKDGAPVLDAIDNVTGRRILLSTGDMTALLLCLTRSVADCCGGKGEGPTYAIVLTTGAPLPQKDGTYQLDLTAALVDAYGQPGPANLPVDWSAGEGAVLSQPQTLTDASGKATVRVSGMAPGGTYAFEAAAIGAKATAKVSLPAAAVASITLAQKNWVADQDGTFQLPFEATVSDQFGQPVAGAALDWTVDPDAKIDAEANSGAGGIGHATIAAMAAGTNYTVTAAAGSITAAMAVKAPTPAPAVISVQEVQRTPLADGTVDVALSAAIVDQFKQPMPKGTDVAWAITDPGRLAQTDTTTVAGGITTNTASGLAPGQYTVAVRAGQVSRTLKLAVEGQVPESTITVTPGDWTQRTDMKAYDLVLSAAVIDRGNPAKEGTTVNWKCDPEAHLPDGSMTDATGVSENTASLLEAGVTYTIFAEALGVSTTIQVTPPQLAESQVLVDLADSSPNRNGTFSAVFVATVTDADGKPMPAVTVAWSISGDVTLSDPESVTNESGVAMTKALQLTQGQAYDVTAEAKGAVGKKTVKF